MRGGFTFPEEDWMGGFRFGPQARLDVVKMWMKSYSESVSSGSGAFALSFDKYDVTSVTTNLGGEISYEIEMESSTFTPRFYALWVHEFENDTQILSSTVIQNPTTPITTLLASPDRDFGRLGVELNWGLSGGISMFLDYEAIVGLKNVESNQFGIGGRVEF
jgi:outer membrane autotransporter protein